MPHGWRWASGWTIDKSQYVDKDGWAYGPDFQNLKWPPTSSRSSTKSAFDVVRRRRWVRRRQQTSNQGVNSFKNIDSVICPGASANLPWRSTFRDSDECLQIRPSVDHPQHSYSWGYAVAVGKDQILMDHSLSKQNSLKQESRLSTSVFKLNQLEKKDMLLCCASKGSKQFWLSIGTDASILHTELNAPVYDWRISVNSPIKLENRLPCPAEFTIWEKTKVGNFIEQQNGRISSRGSFHVYSADIQKPIYLMLVVQGGWVMEKVKSNPSKDALTPYI